jgi:hypothetical protein
MLLTLFHLDAIFTVSGDAAGFIAATLQVNQWRNQSRVVLSLKLAGDCRRITQSAQR